MFSRNSTPIVAFITVLAVAGSAAQTRTVRADVSQVVGPHTQVPLRVIGAGRANEGLRADWQEQLETVELDPDLDEVNRT